MLREFVETPIALSCLAKVCDVQVEIVKWIASIMSRQPKVSFLAVLAFSKKMKGDINRGTYGGGGG